MIHINLLRVNVYRAQKSRSFFVVAAFERIFQTFLDYICLVKVVTTF